MNSLLGIGAGAGIVSALLFVVIMAANALSFVLFLVAPLPILLASLAWNHRAGLVATAVGSLAIGLATGLSNGVAFATSVALPAWWVSYLLLLARHEGGTVEWYPLGRLLAWIAGLSAGLTLLGALLLGDGDYGVFVKAFQKAARLLDEVRPGIFEGLPAAQHEAGIADLGRLLAAVAPPISAGVGVLTTVGLLYLAARIAHASGRLPRPWGGIAATRLPGILAAVLVGAVLLGVVLRGFPAIGVRSLAASLAMAFCLQGLAVLHVLTQGIAGRGAMLGAVYLIFIVLPGWPVVISALVGLLDCVIDFRARRIGPRGPTLPPS